MLTLRTAVAHNAPPVEADAKHEFQQNIMTADFSAPVLFAGVYEYDAEIDAALKAAGML